MSGYSKSAPSFGGTKMQVRLVRIDGADVQTYHRRRSMQARGDTEVRRCERIGYAGVAVLRLLTSGRSA